MMHVTCLKHAVVKKVLTRPPMLYLSIAFDTSKKLLALYRVRDQKALAGMGSVKLTV